MQAELQTFVVHTCQWPLLASGEPVNKGQVRKKHTRPKTAYKVCICYVGQL